MRLLALQNSHTIENIKSGFQEIGHLNEEEGCLFESTLKSIVQIDGQIGENKFSDEHIKRCVLNCNICNRSFKIKRRLFSREVKSCCGRTKGLRVFATVS